MFSCFRLQEYSNLKRGKSSKITEERIALLNTLNFTWKAPRGARPKILSSRVGANVSGTLSSEGKTIRQEVMHDAASDVCPHDTDGALGSSQMEAKPEGLFISHSVRNLREKCKLRTPQCSTNGAVKPD